MTWVVIFHVSLTVLVTVNIGSSQVLNNTTPALSTTFHIQHGSASPGTTPIPTPPPIECLSEVTNCSEALSEASQSIRSNEDYCKVGIDFIKCLLETKQCPEAYVLGTLVPQTKDSLSNSGIECDLSISQSPGSTIHPSSNGSSQVLNNTTPALSTTFHIQHGSTSPGTTPIPTPPSLECQREVTTCYEALSEASQSIRSAEDYCKVGIDFIKCLLETKQCPEAYVLGTLVPQAKDSFSNSGIECDLSVSPSPGSTIHPSSTHESTHVQTPLTTSSPPTEVTESAECFLEIDACNTKLTEQLEGATSFDVVCKYFHELYECLMDTKECSYTFITDQFIPEIDRGLIDNNIFCGLPSFKPRIESSTPSTTHGGLWTTPKFADNKTSDWKEACATGLKKCDDTLLAEAGTAPSHEFCKLISRYVDCYFDVPECDPSFIRNVSLPHIKSSVSDCYIPALDGVQSVENACLMKYEVCEEEYVVTSIGYPRSSYCTLVEKFAKCILDIEECDERYFREKTIPEILEKAAQEIGYECVLSAADLGDSIAGGDNYDGHNSDKERKNNGNTGSISCLFGTQSCSEEFTNNALKVAASDLCWLVSDYVSCMRKIDECDSTFINNRINTDVGPNLAACERKTTIASGQPSLRQRPVVSVLALLIFIALCTSRLY